MEPVRENKFANLCEATRGRIAALSEAGLSANEIAENVGCSTKTVYLWRKKFREQGSVGLKDHRKNNCGPRKTTAEQDQRLITSVRENPFKNSAEALAESGLNICKRTVHRRLKESGLISCRPTKKNVLTAQHRRQRVEFANHHLNKPQREWDTWIWSDEKVFSSSEDGRLRVWRPKGDTRLDPRYVVMDHHSGRISCSFWGCISAAGVMEIQETSVHMKAVKYIDILEQVMVPSAKALFPEAELPQITFVQDNSSVHTAQITRDWFVNHPDILKVDWPAKFPDINPIENIWAIMVREWRSDQARTRQALIDHVHAIWNSLREKPQICHNLVNSMNDRLQQVVEKNGYWINY